MSEYGENVFDVGTDFKIMMTSIKAYDDPYREIDDYEEDWNRPSLKSPHICCSYIRNDLIGTAPIYDICYGFNMNPESLEISSRADLGSSYGGFVPIGYGVNFYSPQEQINRTGGRSVYNEMDYARIQNGQKKQPDYIIVFKRKEDEPPKYLEEAQKASKQFGGLPIVVVDIPKCLKAEREKLDILIERYNNGEKELAKEIYYKIRNNRVTAEANANRETFAAEIDIFKWEEECKKQEEREKKAVKEKQEEILTKEVDIENSEKKQEEVIHEVTSNKEINHKETSSKHSEKSVNLEEKKSSANQERKKVANSSNGVGIKKTTLKMQ